MIKASCHPPVHKRHREKLRIAFLSSNPQTEASNHNIYPQRAIRAEVTQTKTQAGSQCAAAWLAATAAALLAGMLQTGSLDCLCFPCPPCQPKLSHCAAGSFTVDCFSWILLLTPVHSHLCVQQHWN